MTKENCVSRSRYLLPADLARFTSCFDFVVYLPPPARPVPIASDVAWIWLLEFQALWIYHNNPSLVLPKGRLKFSVEFLDTMYVSTIGGLFFAI